MIRKARIEDAFDIAIIARQLHVNHYNIRSDYFNIPDIGCFQASIEQSIRESKDCMTVIYEYESEVLGFAQFYIAENRESEMRKYCKKCFIDAIAVVDSQRNKGIGTKLLEYIKKFAEDNSCHTVELGVWYDNYDAVDFYASIGFEPRMYKLEMKLNY